VLLLSMCLIFSAQVRQFFFCWQSTDIKERGEEEEEEERRLRWRFSLVWTRVCVSWFWWLNLAVRSDLTSNSDRMDLASHVRVSRRAV
jgi:hypothetical protein